MLPSRYVYMGVNPDSSNLMLPTTRAIHALRKALGRPPDNRGPRDHREPTRRKSGLRGALSSVKRSLGMANRIADEWYRQAAATAMRRRGIIVLFDRHFFVDYHAYDIEGATRPLSARIHGYLLQRVYPRPDLVVYLDAPAEVLFARKGEGTVELLERRRQDYLRMRELVPHFTVVDCNRPLDDVVREVQERIEEFCRVRTAERGMRNGRKVGERS